MITKRQEKLLDFLVKEYISKTEPISSKSLKKVTSLDVCGATIRNDLQALTRQGYIKQPHTSAGRVPTEKAYKYFAGKIASENQKIFNDFIFKEIEKTKKQLENEMKLAEELMKSFSEVFSNLEISYNPERETLFRALTILGPTRIICEENESLINKLIKELENF